MGIEHNAIIVSWGYPVAGRETQAGELFASRAAYFEKCKAAGKIEAWEAVILAPHGGEMAGLFLVRGKHEDLQRLADDKDFQESNMRAMYCLSNLAVLNAFTGKAAYEVLTMWGKALPR